MIAKGRYVGQIELDFMVDLDSAGNVTFEVFKNNLNCLNGNIEHMLKPLLAEHSDNILSTLKVTQQYLDVYEVRKME